MAGLEASRPSINGDRYKSGRLTGRRCDGRERRARYPPPRIEGGRSKKSWLTYEAWLPERHPAPARSTGHELESRDGVLGRQVFHHNSGVGA